MRRHLALVAPLLLVLALASVQVSTAPADSRQELPPLLVEETAASTSATAAAETPAPSTVTPVTTEAPRVEPVKPVLEPASHEVLESQDATKLAPTSAPTPAEEHPPAKPDLSVLLASKDDSENDLAEGSAQSGTTGQSVDAKKATAAPETTIELDAGGKPADDRFHYSVSLDSSAAEKEKGKEKPLKDKATEGDREQTAAPAPAKDDEESKEKEDDITTQAPSTTTTSTLAPTTETHTEPPKASSAESTAMESEKEASSTEVPAPSTSAPVAKKAEEAPKPEDNKMTTTSASTGTDISTTTTAKPPLNTNSSILSTAISSAAGSAIGSAIGAAAADIKPIKAPAPKLPTMSSKRPSLSFDHWNDRRPLSPTTNSPSSRRRPILPSIRRRFRPFGTPFGAGIEPFESETSSDSEFGHGFGSSSPFGPSAFRPMHPLLPGFDSLAPKAGPGSSTRRPCRRCSTTTSSSSSSPSESTTEAPLKPAGLMPALKPTIDDDPLPSLAGSDSELPGSLQPATRTRNRHNRPNYGSNERRRHHSNRPGGQPSFESAFPSRPFGSSGFGGILDGGFGGSPFGFDALLNPFASWLDELIPSANGAGKKTNREDGGRYRPPLYHSQGRHHNREEHEGGYGHRSQHGSRRPPHGHGGGHGGGYEQGHEHGHGHGHGYGHDRHDEYDAHDHNCHHNHEYDRPPYRPHGSGGRW